MVVGDFEAIAGRGFESGDLIPVGACTVGTEGGGGMTEVDVLL